MYKYIHIFGIDELILSSKVIEFINESGFIDATQHCFVTPFKRVYDKLSLKYDNVQYFECSEVYDSRIINYYAKRYDYVFLHSIPPIYKALLIRWKYCPKIIWRTWGHDAGYDYHHKWSDAIKFVLMKLWKMKVNKFKVVAVANIIDEEDMRRRYGDKINCMLFSYLSKNNSIDFKELSRIRNESDEVNILLGHSGTRPDNHFKILDKLRSYAGKPVHIWILLAYGDKDYIAEVIKYANTIKELKITIVDQVVPKDKYIEFLTKMDAGILDGKGSYAISNLIYLLRLNKHVILNKDGLIKRVFDKCKIPCFTTEQLGTVSVEELKASPNYNDEDLNKISYNSFDYHLATWQELFNSLN